MIEVVEIDSFEQLSEYGQQWNELLQNSETNAVYLTYEWVITCWQIFGKNSKLMVIIVEDDGDIIGIAPLAITVQKRFGHQRRTIEFISSIWADYNDIIASKESKPIVLEAIFSYLCSIKDRWDVIKLNDIPSKSSTASICKDKLSGYFRFLKITDSSVCPQLLFEGSGDRITKNILRRKDFKYRHNWLKGRGNLVYRDCESAEEILSLINTYFDYHISRWEPTETKSLFYSKINREFFRAMVKNMFDTGHLKFSVLSLNNLPVSFCFGFEYNRMVIRYKSTFNNAFRKRSVGLVLLKLMIEEAMRKGLRGIDYVRGAESYKFQFSNTEARNKCIYAYHSVLSYILNGIEESIRRSLLLRWLRGKRSYLRFRRVIRQYRGMYGWKFILKILQRLFSKIFILSRSYLFAVTKPAEVSVEPKCPIQIRKASEKDIWLVASFYGCEEGSDERKEIVEALQAGDECFLMFEGLNVVHCSWLRRGRPIGIGLKQLYQLDLGAGEACVYHSKTSPVYRGLNFYPAMLLHIQKQFFARKGEKIYICCGVENIASVKGIQKAGFSFVKTIRAVRLFGRKIGSETIPAES